MGLDDRDYMRDRYRKRQGLGGTYWNDRKSRVEHGGAWFEDKNRGHDYQTGRYRAGRQFRAHPIQGWILGLSALLTLIPMYREMIETGAWWDLVDGIAPGPLHAVLQHDRIAMSAMLRQWARDNDMWIRRAAIICQLRARAETDLALLYDCIAPSLDSKEFFLRKAIGWALRQYARTDPAEVARYVAANADRLSPLSRREALKRIA